MNPFKKQLNKLRKGLTADEARVKTIQAYQSAFDTPDGHLVLMDLADRIGFLAPPLASANEQQHAYYAGQQSVLAFIVETMNIDVSVFFKKEPTETWVNTGDSIDDY